MSDRVPEQSPAAAGADELGLAEVGERLQQAWARLVDAESGQLPRPTSLAANWGLNQTLCTRLVQALRESDPASSLSRFPSPGSLRTVLRVAEQRSVAADRLADADRAVRDFELLIARCGGTKSNLDTIISRQLDHSREKIEQNAKQLVFRGMTSLYGVEAKLSVVMCFAFPGADPTRSDELVVYGHHGLRRLRPELPLMLGTREMLADCDNPEDALLETLHGGRIDADGETTALTEFCSDPFPEIEVRRDGGRLLYALSAQPDQFGGELDLFFASLHRNADPLIATPEHPRARFAFIPKNPARHLLFDFFVHEDLWRGVEPELILARVGDAGAPDLLAHSLDRLDFVETLQHLGPARSSISTPHYGRYSELVRTIHSKMGWTEGSFRVYRCAVKYPVVGLWYTIQFRLPEH